MPADFTECYLLTWVLLMCVIRFLKSSGSEYLGAMRVCSHAKGNHALMPTTQPRLWNFYLGVGCVCPSETHVLRRALMQCGLHSTQEYTNLASHQTRIGLQSFSTHQYDDPNSGSSSRIRSNSGTGQRAKVVKCQWAYVLYSSTTHSKRT